MPIKDMTFKYQPGDWKLALRKSRLRHTCLVLNVLVDLVVGGKVGYIFSFLCLSTAAFIFWWDLRLIKGRRWLEGYVKEVEKRLRELGQDERN